MALFNLNIKGKVIPPVTGETVVPGKIVYLAPDGIWYHTSASLKSKSTTELRLVVGKALAGDPVQYISYGEFSYPSGSLVPGDKYYLSVDSGDITNTIYNNSSNVIRYIGTAKSDTTLLFNPDQTYISDFNSTVNNVVIKPSSDILLDHNHLEEDIPDLDKYTQNEVQELLADKVNKAGDEITGDLTVPSLLTDYIDFNSVINEPAYKEGRLYYDKVHKTLTLFNDESETSLQIGEEQRVRVYNNNGVTIPQGSVVTVVGVQPEGSDYVVQVELAIASDETSALNTIGIATHDIEIGTFGWATTSGVLHDVDTSLYTEGAALWLSDTTPGAFRESRPASPNYEVRMGGIIKSDVINGQIYAELRIISNDHDNSRFLNGSILEDHKTTIVKTPTTTTLRITSPTSEPYISVIFNQNYTKVIVPVDILLTNGTDAAPQINYIYINSLGVITKSLTGFPTAEQFAPVATLIVQSAASVNTYGLYKHHAWTDHLADSTGQGHLSHLNKWIRNRPALWKSGVVFSSTIGSSLPTIPITYSSGVVSQLHLHNFPAINTATGSGLYGINNPITPYARRTSISPSIDTDSLGGPIGNNKYYTLILWGVVSEALVDCKVMFNLPSGSYSNVTDALNDVNKYNNYTIPDEYVGTGFLLTQITIQRSTSSVQIISGSVKDLRGLFPASGGGGGTTGGTGITKFTELTDTPIAITANAMLSGNSGGTALEFLPTPTASQLLRRKADNLSYEWFTLPSYEPSFTKNTAFNKNFSTTTTDIKVNGVQSLGILSTLARADHIHPTDTTREGVGIAAGLIGTHESTYNHSNYDTAYGWGNHALAGYLTAETDSQILSWTELTRTLSISNGNSVILTGLDRNIDGGAPDSVYLPSQVIDGGFLIL